MFRCYYPSGFTTEQTSSVKNRITHKWYKSWDLAQQVVQYAYEYTSWDMDFIYMMECESWMKPTNKWDSWKANYHKIPQEYYDDRWYQVRYCYDKYKSWTKFYWSTRIIKWQYCANYVKDRFIIE